MSNREEDVGESDQTWRRPCCTFTPDNIRLDTMPTQLGDLLATKESHESISLRMSLPIRFVYKPMLLKLCQCLCKLYSDQMHVWVSMLVLKSTIKGIDDTGHKLSPGLCITSDSARKLLTVK